VLLHYRQHLEHQPQAIYRQNQKKKKQALSLMPTPVGAMDWSFASSHKFDVNQS